ncbi:LOW QUALITY PROTEIN: inter-alpha-trypsin inhibitor heavy chain H3 [Hipposideros larvatus]
MASVQWSCLILALLSGLVIPGFPGSPSRQLEKRSLSEGEVDGIEVYSTKISCKVTSRFAHNVVTTRAVNRANAAKEVSFDVELPKTAFITNFTLTIDGVTYSGNVKEKEVAKKQYEKAVSQGKTAGLVNLCLGGQGGLPHTEGHSQGHVEADIRIQARPSLWASSTFRSGFYEEVANPLLTGVEVEYPENAILDLTQNTYKHFYDGSEIVVAGRLVDQDMNSFKADVKGHGAINDLTFTEEVDVKDMEKALQERDYIFGNYIERLWVYLTIEQLLERSKNAQGDEKENLTAQALDLSLKYHFVTPLTSMVVTKPEDNENQTAIVDKPGEGPVDSGELQPAAGWVSQKGYKTEAGSPCQVRWGCPDWERTLRTPGLRSQLCCQFMRNPGPRRAPFPLRTAPSNVQSWFTVNGQIIGDKSGSPNSETRKTYFGKLGIANAQMDFIEVTPEKITLWNGAAQSTFSWLDTVKVTQDGLSVMINRRKNMVVSSGDGVTFVVVLHQVWKKHPVHQDFLGFYVVDSHRMSAQTHGLLGQFFHPFDFQVSHIHPGSDPTKPHATMVVKNHRLTVTRGSQKDYRKDVSSGTKVACWFVHNNGQGLIDGVHSDYIVPELF